MIKSLIFSLIPLIVFGIINVGTVNIFKKSYGKCLPVTFIMSTLVMFFSQVFFKTFNVGLIVILLLFLGSLILFITKRKDSSYIELLLSRGGLLSFVLIYLFLLVLNYSRHYWYWDEFSHWGKMLKEMIRLDSFYCVDESTLLVHKDYPPFFQLFEYLFIRLSNVDIEMMSTLALHVFEYAILIPTFIEKLVSDNDSVLKQISKIILSVFGLSLVIFYFDVYSVFNTIHLDIVIALLFAYAMSIIIDDEQRNSLLGYLSVVLLQIALILTKEIDIAFILLTWLLYTLLEVIKNGIKKQTIVYSSLILIIPIIFNRIWANILSNYTFPKQFDLSKFSIGNFIGIIVGSGSEIQVSTFKLFANALFYKEIAVGNINLTYVSASLLLLLSLTVIYQFNKKIINKKEYLSYLLVMVLGIVFYALTILIIYLFFMLDFEMAELMSYERYMDTFFLAMYLFLVIIAIKIINKKYVLKNLDIKYLIFALLMLVVLLDCSKLYNFVPRLLMGNPYGYYDEVAEIIKEENSNSNLFIIAEDTQETSYYLNYYLDETIIDTAFIQSDCSKMDYLKNKNEWNSIVEEIKKNEYLYIFECSDNVKEALREFSKDLKDDSLYRVSVENNALKLQLVKNSK